MPDTYTLAPAPPSLPGLTWRRLTPADLPALIALAQTWLRADGGLPFLFVADYLKGFFFPDAAGVGLGAFDSDERMAAAATLHLDAAGATPRAKLVGGVRPDWRRQGLGAYLLRWGQAQAQALLPAGGQRVLRVATESLSAAAHTLYLAHGFENVFDEFVMRRDLRQPLPDRPLPEGVTLTPWQPEAADDFFQAYHAAFRERPGFPDPSAADWIAGVLGDDIVLEWTLLARAGDLPLGFILGTLDLTADPPGGYVAQIGVVPAARRRGLASALMVESLRRMQAAGAPCADLTVHLNNPGAIEAYAGLGFVTIGRRARYERVL